MATPIFQYTPRLGTGSSTGAISNMDISHIAIPTFEDTPWLGGEHDGYLRVPFEKYLELNRVSEVSNDPGREYLAKLQCLMNFGLLEAVMEVKIAENQLLELNSSGERVLTSKNLQHLFRDFINRFLQLKGKDETRIPVACREWIGRIEATLNDARDKIYSESSKEEKSMFLWTGLKPQVLAEIIIQMLSIHSAVHFSIICMLLGTKMSVQTKHMKFMELVPDRHRATILKPGGIVNPGGWCPAIMGRLADYTNPGLLGYSRTLKSPQSRSSEGHGECTPQSCVVITRDTSNDPPKHVSESCKCNNSKPSLDDVKRFLQNGKIPVVEFREGVGVSVRNSSSTPYVAISHVWGDGLRGTTEKGLPECQVKRLAKMTRRILKMLGCPEDGDGGFWIDTLCIPETGDLRHDAIGLMARTYTEAEAVLVIDSGIREISGAAPLVEKLFNVLLSRWMQRLWTFQEGILAKKLYFEFLDDVLISREELLPDPDGVMNCVHYSLCVLYSGLGGVKRDIELSDVFDALRKRSVSRKSDELLAVCGVLDLDGRELARISDLEERMASFLQKIERLHSNIIFHNQPNERRLDKEGFRWAPKTFMRAEFVYMREGILRRTARDAVCTSTGLEAEYLAMTEGVEIGGELPEFHTVQFIEGRPVVDIYELRPFRSSVPVKIPSCNTILFDGASPDSGVCAGVWVDPEALCGGSGGDRILCKFWAPVFYKRIGEIELEEVGKDLSIVPVVRRMRVKVV